LALEWLTAEHAALLSAAATAGVFGVGAWVAGEMSRADELMQQLSELQAQITRPPPSLRSAADLQRHHISSMIQMMDKIIELRHVEREELRLRAEANKRLMSWVGRVTGALVVLVTLAGSVIALWDRFAI
jgi:hypothetical protein